MMLAGSCAIALKGMTEALSKLLLGRNQTQLSPLQAQVLQGFFNIATHHDDLDTFCSTGKFGLQHM